MGLGVSGVAAAELLLSERSQVTVIDAADNLGLRKEAAKLRKKGAHVILAAHSVPEGVFDVCIVSPGIRSDSDWVRVVEKRGIEVLSELELGATRCACPMLAITGSKGKSTMVKFCGDALALAGKRVEIAGNYGPPLCGVVIKKRTLDWVVVEVSSFQLERVKSFRPVVGVLLNVQPDHLDRHGSMAAYVGMKAGMFNRMIRGDLGVVLDENLSLIKKLSKGANRWLSFGLSDNADYQYQDGKVFFKTVGRGRKAVDFRGTIFANEVLGLMTAAAVAVLRVCGVGAQLIEKVARKYKPLPHRMQIVARKKGVAFINDSKATNLAALAAGIKMCNGPVRLIAGGLLKESKLNFVKKTLVNRVARAYLIGKAAKQMENEWGRSVSCVQCGNIKTAIKSAWSDAKSGDFVLLSPGCASFDQFEDFEDRGRQFTRAVKLLK
ncbi:MAG: UDP-N-acetylmuramoylalanine--D-glutamate ligase [Lentisphaerae bacterium RIFOXYA12_FULL_48_11]|nr:MAG: UDP-N-acetylmuramoylalanine--D-glutamate ligase [Lentisphaerae bacterium RIFOXYA12_FULL_48_11]